MTDWQQRTYCRYFGTDRWIETDDSPPDSEGPLDDLIRRVKAGGIKGGWTVILDTDDRMVASTTEGNWTWLWLAWR